jgi:hypothetical protein
MLGYKPAQISISRDAVMFGVPVNQLISGKGLGK